MSEWIHFKAPGGHLISMTLPLHSTIEQQWEHGDLQRVTQDGSPWVDSVDSATDPSDASSEREAPVRPKATAKVAEWQEYAVALGACTEEEAAAMTKAQLVELCTPQELLPPDPEV